MNTVYRKVNRQAKYVGKQNTNSGGYYSVQIWGFFYHSNFYVKSITKLRSHKMVKITVFESKDPFKTNWFHGNFSVEEKFLIFHTVILHKEWASSTSISVNTSSLFSLGNLNTAWITFLLLSITYHIYYTIHLKLNVLTRFTVWNFQNYSATQILREIRLYK